MQLSTGNAYGFSTSEIEVFRLNDVYNGIVKTDTSQGASHFGASVNNLFGNGSGVPYIARWAWYKLFNLFPANSAIKLSLNAINFNGENLSTAQSTPNIAYAMGMNMDPPEILATPSYMSFRLQIVNVNRGINNTFTVLDAKEDELHRLKDLELPFIQSQHHKLRLYRDNVNSIIMVTNQFNPEKTFWQMFGMLPIFYPEIKAIIEAPENEKMRNIFKAFYECDGDAFKPYIMEDYDSIERLKTLKHIASFERILQSIGSRQINALSNDIQSLEHNMNSYYEQAMQYSIQVEDKKRMLTGLQIMGITIDTAALEFLKNSKKIQIHNIEGNDYITFKVTTPLTNYVSKDMQSYYNHNDSTNFVTHHAWIASLMKEVFIEEKYQFVLTTFIKVPLNNGSWRITPDSSTYTGNPHLTIFDCYSSAKATMSKFLREGRILDMMNQLIATCASITVVDSAVMRRFIDNLRSGESANHAIIQNVETGEFMTPMQYKDAYEQIVANTAI